MDAKEHQEKTNAAALRRIRHYKTLFLTPKITPAQLNAARKGVLADMDGVLRANVHIPDKNGHYDSVRAALEDGGRKIVNSMLGFINHKFDEEDKKGKPTVRKKK